MTHLFSKVSLLSVRAVRSNSMKRNWLRFGVGRRYRSYVGFQVAFEGFVGLNFEGSGSFPLLSVGVSSCRANRAVAVFNPENLK